VQILGELVHADPVQQVAVPLSSAQNKTPLQLLDVGRNEQTVLERRHRLKTPKKQLKNRLLSNIPAQSFLFLLKRPPLELLQTT
jgi:hypothetical protein